MDYSDQLDHLDKLMESFQTYHKGVNEVKIKDSEG